MLSEGLAGREIKGPPWVLPLPSQEVWWGVAVLQKGTASGDLEDPAGMFMTNSTD